MRVVFHADDLGLTPAINAGVVEAAARGVLRSASVLVTAGAAEDAIRGSRGGGCLDLGIHLAWVEERPALAPAAVPSLVSGELFLPSYRAVLRRYLRGGWRLAEAEAEMAAQWELFEALGGRASHCDAHQHLHLLPGLFSRVVRAALARGARFVRARFASGAREPRVTWRRSLAVGGMRAVAALSRMAVWRADALQCVRAVTLGVPHAGGRLTVEGLVGGLERLRRRGTEIAEVIVHPGYADGDTLRKYGHWGYDWERDRALLLDPRLPEELARRGIEVTSFRDLAADGGRCP